MTIRKRNDDRGYERGAKGIDDDSGSDFTQKYNVPNRRGDSYPGGTKGGSEGNGHEPSNERSYDPPYSENESGLTQGTDLQFRGRGASTQRGTPQWGDDILDDVEANSRPRGDDNFGFDATGAIRSGINKSQDK